MEPILYQWHFDPYLILLAIGLIYAYYSISDTRPVRRRICFWSAILLFLVATCSPLHYLGTHAYFSAHMIAHVLLLLICGPLLVLSMSPVKILRSLSASLHKRPWLAWLAGVGIMWFWHIPAVFDTALGSMQGSSPVPLLHAGSMLLAGMLFAWPLFGPFPNDHIHPLAGVIYLFTACISCSLLGLLITFAPMEIYHHYTGGLATGTRPLMKMALVNPWNISPDADQQAAGLIMWVPCCLVYLSGCLYLLQRWLSAKPGRHARPAPPDEERVKPDTEQIIFNP